MPFHWCRLWPIKRRRAKINTETGLMKTITTTAALAAFCAEAAKRPYVTVDTEFLRERTYYSKLCLLQMAYQDDAGNDAVLVDTLADGLSLDPVYDLFRDPGVVKVFHAARQDLEIFFVDAGVIPAPLFDTQVAAMVCGFGEQAGYETLVRKICKGELDKSSRFTDWSRRPLTDAQLKYAVEDVTYLRDIYEYLDARLAKSGRQKWVAEEMAVLNDPATYRVEPDKAWLRVKTRTSSPRFLAIVRELARFRESYAQSRDIPRSRVYKDDALVELASTKPQSEQDLGRSRLLLREARRGDIADGILAAVKAGLEAPQDSLPKPDKSNERMQVNPAIADLLRVLLKAKSDNEGVAAKLIATTADLDALAAGGRDLPALHGWRREVFGDEALLLCQGKVALATRGNSVVTIRL
jgi:ribonuclease D